MAARALAARGCRASSARRARHPRPCRPPAPGRCSAAAAAADPQPPEPRAPAVSDGAPEAYGGWAAARPFLYAGALALAALGAAVAGAYSGSGGRLDVAFSALYAALKGGFTMAFSLVFVSEIGDKTFFIAALLAARRGRLLVLTGATLALALMTVVSVGIGSALQYTPSFVATSAPIGEYLAVVLLVFFGVRTLREALAQPAGDAEDDGSELQDAEEAVSEAEKKGVAPTTPWGVVVETFTLIFVAEWGDRSMLSTIALGAAQNPVAVALGATAGHVLATMIAVVGGALLSKHISERAIGIAGGSLFLLFAALTVAGVF